MKKKDIAAVALLAILALSFYLRTISIIYFDIFIGIVAVVAAYEVATVFARIGFRINKSMAIIFPSVSYLAYMISLTNNFNAWLIILSQLLSVVFAGIACFIIEVILGIINNSKLKKLPIKKQKTQTVQKINIGAVASKTTVHTLLTFIYPTLFISLLFVLNNFSNIKVIAGNKALDALDIGMLAIILLFSISVFTDMFAQFTGSAFKGPKINPLVSPHKTWSGAIGGLFFGTLSTVIIYWIYVSNDAVQAIFVLKNITPVTFLIIGFFGSIANQIGDFFASYLKRKAGVKDFSSLLPGHGGVMDRFNGIMVNAIIIVTSFCILFLI